VGHQGTSRPGWNRGRLGLCRPQRLNGNQNVSRPPKVTLCHQQACGAARQAPGKCFRPPNTRWAVDNELIPAEGYRSANSCVALAVCPELRCACLTVHHWRSIRLQGELVLGLPRCCRGAGMAVWRGQDQADGHVL
jgi:hypothetical protein